MKQNKILLKQKSGFLVKQKPNYKLTGFQEIIEHKFRSVHKTKRRLQVLNKNKPLKKRILLGTIAMFLMGVLVFSTLQGTAVITEDSQYQNDIPQPGIPFEIPIDGTPVALIPGEELTLETPTGVNIELIVNESVNITVIESTDLPAEAGELPAEAYGIGLYLAIELNDSDVEMAATLSLPYDPATLPEGVAEEHLYFAFYDTLTDEWEGVPSWVDTNLGAVYGNTTHFSTWTVLGETESTDQTTDQSTSSSTISPQPSLWLNFNNVKDGFLISFTVMALFLFVVAIVNRRQK